MTIQELTEAIKAVIAKDPLRCSDEVNSLIAAFAKEHDCEPHNHGMAMFAKDVEGVRAYNLPTCPACRREARVTK